MPAVNRVERSASAIAARVRRRRSASSASEPTTPIEHEQNQRDQIDDLGQGTDSLAPRGAGGSRTKRRVEGAEDHDRDQVEGGLAQPRQDRGGEQLADRLLGDDPEYDQRTRRWNQRSERAARGEGPCGEAGSVAGLAHLGQRHRSDRRRGRQARAADRAESGAAGDRGQGQAAAAVADELRGNVEEVAARTRGKAQVGHQQEQRQDAELVFRDHLERGHPRLDQRRLGRNHQGDAANPDQDQSHPDRHPRAKQQQQDDDSDQTGKFGRDHGCFRQAARTNSKAMNSAKTTHSTRSQRSGRWSSSVCS
jgi:hypothetical protein